MPNVTRLFAFAVTLVGCEVILGLGNDSNDSVAFSLEVDPIGLTAEHR
jgi:hypothetical protein